MKKTLLALAGAVILLGLVLGVKTCSDRRMTRELFVFDTTKVSRVERLEIAYGGEKAVLVKRDGRWLTAGDDYPVDSLRMHRVLTALLRTRATEQVSQSGDPARLAEFGLGDEAKRIRWKLASGEEYTLLLGKTSGTDYSSTYWKWEDAKDVYRTPGNFTHEASVREVDWKSRRIFPAFPFEDVASITVDWLDSAGSAAHYRIDRTSDSSASLMEPLRAALPPQSAGLELFGQVPQFSADAFAEAWEDRAAMRLDTPQVRITVTLKDKTVHRLAAGDTVLEGGQVYRYALLPGTKHIVKIHEGRFAFFRLTVQQLLSPSPRMPDAPAGGVETIDPESFGGLE